MNIKFLTSSLIIPLLFIASCKVVNTPDALIEPEIITETVTETNPVLIRRTTIAEANYPAHPLPIPKTQHTIVPSFFGNHAVLQRDKPIRIFGTDQSSQQIAVTFFESDDDSLVSEAIADSNGQWSVEFPAKNAGGPYKVMIQGTETVVYRDIMIGDVWICAGQSNIEWPLASSNDGARYAAESENPNIRFFRASYHPVKEPTTNLRGAWERADPISVLQLSAIGYHFAKKLEADQNIPIGIIQTAVGGTRIESWLPPESFTKNFYGATYYQNYHELAATDENEISDNEKYADQLEDWLQKNLKVFEANDGLEKGWHLADLDDSEWPEMETPGRLETFEQIKLDGIFWFRKTVTLDQKMAASDLQLSLGGIDDYDEVYVNGKLVGSTNLQTAAAWGALRNYIIPASVIQEGENLIAIKVIDIYSGGGFAGPASAMTLSSTNHEVSEIIKLDGTWKYGIDGLLPIEKATAPANILFPPYFRERPSTLYNSLVAPLLRLPVKGIVWYQGESNANEAVHYEGLLKEYLNIWRNTSVDSTVPFLIVQITGFGINNPAGLSSWPMIREAQFNVAQYDPNAWIVNTIDVGNCENIHPDEKALISQRLFNLAKQVFSGAQFDQKLSTNHPVFKSMKLMDNREYRIEFHNVSKSLKQTYLDEKDEQQNTIRGFYTANGDGHFYEADARIDDKSIILKPNHRGNAVHLRYNWHECPEYFILDEDNLPLFPFRTDSFFRALQVELPDE